jgi:hypothetical protein
MKLYDIFADKSASPIPAPPLSAHSAQTIQPQQSIEPIIESNVVPLEPKNLIKEMINVQLKVNINTISKF